VDILGYQRLVNRIPCLCGMGCKRLLILEMEVRVSVYLDYHHPSRYSHR